ncbi:MAG: pyruvate dehydrogenase [Chloroflexi bacterium]|nr:pyruvate dehydrogenase [Chloroflexota bacterium]
MMDEMEENELVPQGKVNYQFSARGHELGQLLLSQLLTHPHDAASVYYRSRPFTFGSGLTLEEAFASDMARPSGTSGGRDVGVVCNMPRRGRALILPGAGDVGSQFTPAAGWAQAIVYHTRELGETDWADSIAVVFGGDGAVATNGFWSALTIATTQQLPLLFVVEDNGYAISVESPQQTPGGNIAANLASFHSLRIWDGSGTRPAETAELVYEAVRYMRSGQGAGLLRLTVPRLSGHSSVDNQAYKSAEVIAEEWQRDPTPEPTRINFIEAIRRTLDCELSLNPRCVVFGEDVGKKGGVHAATLGLQTKHGARRVFDTSLSEEGIVGRAVGMAYAGLMPVPEIQFRKYADPATEQINNCGTVRWRTNNRFAAPIVIRIPGGYRKIGDPWHSVTSEITFAHQPGWRFACPSNAEDAVGLLRTALRGNDPVIFFEHRAMLDSPWARRPYPGDDYLLPFGRAKIIQPGDDLTVVTWGAMVERCELAARELNASIEIIDLRTLSPWDTAAVLESVRKTGKCLVVHEDILFGGFGAEIAAVVASEGFTYLDGPVERLGAPSAPVPFSTSLMEGIVPTVALIREKMESLLEY